ncbi:dynamin family protein [Thermosynechococcus sp. PP45]|uniref:dynamin family protein n=1 Tax=unclassified Thermosynechococcus TaxID=2622553 RepID=UPI0026740D9D|nr:MULTISPECIES: dynamin family protein [unclassified Thermosynechococcus]MDR5639664.1 dynamin family protein [Thermosynechococcus sp. PP42]MDR7921669.1 dynamin family protein [Thermosynechococcus sp. HY213]WKT82231.1 dynamin family protein [Thermosynechococcus sp. PP45]WNC25848.1 dynamin family protein [Thermosynechococcus sp. PP551]WNC28428.1 dynamin family protein [Thermosynechococcus sp. PP555]
MEISSLLEAALEHLKAVDTAVNQITKRDPQILNQPHLQAILQQFYDTYTEAKERLEHPTFRIATIGTTSSGKSTLVNALIGRRIAPIEAQQMSAGILRIHHSLQNRLVINPTIGWQNLTDEDIYSKIKECMTRYHERKKVESDLPFPEIEVYCPILPVIDRLKIGLPESVNIEILDLPGLESINDQKNLKLIQDTIKGCFSIVTINYQETDSDKQETLLKELKDIVEWFGGDPKMMIFILNKIDSRTSEDDSIEKRIQNLKAQIQTTLGLGTPPEIIPMTALFLYYAQLIHAYSESAYQLDILENLLHDCANIFTREEKYNEEIANFYDDLRRKSRRKTALTSEESKKLLDYALNISGSKIFWQTLSKYCQSSFRQSVLAPILLDFINKSKNLQAEIGTALEIKRKISIEEIEEEKQEIETKQKEIQKKIEETFEEFSNKLNQLSNVMISKSTETEKRSKIKELRLPEQCQGNVTKTIDFPSEVKTDLSIEILSPVNQYLRGSRNYDSHSLPKSYDNLRQILQPHLFNRVLQNCQNLSEVIDKSIDILINVLDADDNTKNQIINQVEEAIEGAIIVLNFDIEEACQERTRFLIQAHRSTLENFANSYSQITLDNLIHKINEILPQLSIAERIKTSIEAARSYPNVDDLLKNLSIAKRISIPISNLKDTGEAAAGGAFLAGMTGALLGLIFGLTTAGVGAAIGFGLGAAAGSSIDRDNRIKEIKDLKLTIINKLYENWESSLGASEFNNKVVEAITRWVTAIIDDLRERIQETVKQVSETSIEYLDSQRHEIEQKRQKNEDELDYLNQQNNLIIDNLTKLKKIAGVESV